VEFFEQSPRKNIQKIREEKKWFERKEQVESKRNGLKEKRKGLKFEKDEIGFYGERAIRTRRLNTLRCLHLGPINLVVSEGPSGRTNLGVGFPLRCLQRLSRGSMATRRDALGRTTGTPEAAPVRSSRTRTSSPQSSCAHGG
jgi:hypothetical protein